MKIRTFAFSALLVTGSAFAAETDVTVPGSAYDSPGVFALPEADAPVPAVLLIHGFASDKEEVGGFYADLAVALEAEGVASLRFDFPGSGDHEEGFEVNNWSTFTRDAREAFDWLAAQDGVDDTRLGVVGFSLGGAIAANLAGSEERVQALALWSAAGHMADSQDDLYETYYETAVEEGSAEADLGFRTAELSREYFESRFSAFPLFDIRSYTEPLLVVAGELDESVPVHTARDFVQNSGSNDVTLRVFPDSDHIFNVLTDDPADSEAVLELTATWLGARLGN